MKALKTPKVSIAICTFNGSKYISAQLESIINQSYKNLEIIIVDDRSADDTVEICRSYSDKRIKIFVNEQNLGYTKNFEKSITLCSGDYISLCDQDDIWELNKIEILIREISECVLVYHNSDFIDQFGKKIEEPNMAQRYHMYDGYSALPFLLFNCISGHAAMFSKELIQYLLPFDPMFFHDWWLAYIAVNSGKIKFIEDVLVHYRQHTGSVTDNLGLKPNGKTRGKRITIDINWLKKCADYHFNKNPELINKAYHVFKNLTCGKKRLSAFLFTVKHYDELFFIANRKNKSFISKINFARKISFSDTSLL